MSERFVLAREGCDLVGERWPGGAPLVVLLHEGVSDRRGWRRVAGLLAPQVTVVAYDRRGYGESRVSTAPFTDVDDVLAILDRERATRAWLAGASAGGGLALDTAPPTRCR
jgi:pimeloyl-ACP methyl ester carboxylesterase